MATFSTATWPFSASPHTCQSVLCSMNSRSRLRIELLSSAMRILKDMLGSRVPWRVAGGILALRERAGDGGRHCQHPSPQRLGSTYSEHRTSAHNVMSHT